MKKAIYISWTIFLLAILMFVISVFTSDSDGTTWRMFSIIMPIAGISFWVAIILTIVHVLKNYLNK